ncbi:MAG TPA: 16S rRNA (guanine(966)-N(2))-methyltransferase RsmD [Candidatus Dorea intestinavium]|nr:16S rRNA (guanine(966)-N(2))-methyltransferase RsmD [Candidatus Dorea intestinavium]
MRVIAGKAKSLKLKTIPGLDTRPTQDKIKETLFNMIAREIPQCSFLDLFSGSGAIGIEALSRGARNCIFVEDNKKALAIIRENLRFTHLEEEAQVIKANVLTFLKNQRNLKKEPFDVIFMDPPYGKQLEKEALILLSGSNLIKEETLIIVEADLKTDFDYLKELGFTLIKTKKYKSNKHVFIVLEEK